jgi:hypothetical protein
LIIMPQTVGVFAISPVCGSSRWLNIRNGPWLGPQYSEKGGRVESTGSHFQVVWLLKKTPLSHPVCLKGEDQFLKIHPNTSFCHALGETVPSPA